MGSLALRGASPYGNIGRPIKLLETFSQWRDWQEEQIELGLVEADSKADFPEFLFGSVRQMLWHGYSRVEGQYRKYARVESAPDFRERRLRGLNMLQNYGYVGDHGEYVVMQRSERPAASLSLDTYGAIYAITRQAIINDDSGELLNRNPSEMGFRAGQFVVRTIIALIESNPDAPDGDPMYGTGRGNQFTLPLSEDALATVLTFMETQIDDNGDPIMVNVRTIAVQNMRLELIAKRILRSSEAGTAISYTGAVGVGSAIMDKGTDNPLAGILAADAVTKDPYWSDSNNWYVFASPDDVPGFAVAFLNGNETPDVFIKDPGVRNALGPGTDPYSFDLDSVDFKVRHDFGAAPVDPRGVARSIVA